MKTTSGILTGFASLAFVLIACNEEETDTGVDAWQGETPHLAISGTLNGEEVDVDLSPEDAADLATLWCTREYEAPEDSDGEPIIEEGVLDEISLQVLNVSMGGEQRDIQIEFKSHDFGADEPGTVLQVVPRVEDPAAPGTLYVEWEWYLAGEFLADEDAYYEGSAVDGTVEVALYTGEIGADGVTIPDNTGSFGVYADVYWSESEHLQISFTANCGENDF